jgi:16S rRNA (guanine966-N2)-methyltransferase
MQIISGQYKSRKLLAPKGQHTRPTSGRLREALFNICQAEIKDATFLDLFAGSGAMGIEALSRGAKRVVFVDNNRESIRCIQANLIALKIEKNSEVIHMDVFEAMKKLAKRGVIFDVIYADPPYNQTTSVNNSLSRQVVVVLDELIDQKLTLLKTGGTLIVEDAANALSEVKKFKHVILQDQRKMGRSALQRWSYCAGIKESEI